MILATEAMAWRLNVQQYAVLLLCFNKVASGRVQFAELMRSERRIDFVEPNPLESVKYVELKRVNGIFPMYYLFDEYSQTHQLHAAVTLDVLVLRSYHFFDRLFDCIGRPGIDFGFVWFQMFEMDCKQIISA